MRADPNRAVPFLAVLLLKAYTARQDSNFRLEAQVPTAMDLRLVHSAATDRGLTRLSVLRPSKTLSLVVPVPLFPLPFNNNNSSNSSLRSRPLCRCLRQRPHRSQPSRPLDRLRSPPLRLSLRLSSNSHRRRPRRSLTRLRARRKLLHLLQRASLQRPNPLPQLPLSNVLLPSLSPLSPLSPLPSLKPLRDRRRRRRASPRK